MWTALNSQIFLHHCSTTEWDEQVVIKFKYLSHTVSQRTTDLLLTKTWPRHILVFWRERWLVPPDTDHAPPPPPPHWSHSSWSWSWWELCVRAELRQLIWIKYVWSERWVTSGDLSCSTLSLLRSGHIQLPGVTSNTQRLFPSSAPFKMTSLKHCEWNNYNKHWPLTWLNQLSTHFTMTRSYEDTDERGVTDGLRNVKLGLSPAILHLTGDTSGDTWARGKTRDSSELSWVWVWPWLSLLTTLTL